MFSPIIKIVIPARNEVLAIGSVVASIIDKVDKVIVVDNGSSDGTAEAAKQLGASTVNVPEPGYGRACLAGIEAAEPFDILVFMDGDASDDPADLRRLLAPILSGQAQFVLGSRLIGDVEVGALTFPQKFGNRLACGLMRLIWKSKFTDLGPFRAITAPALKQINMQAPTFGWTVEMQARILKQDISYVEVPVRYRKRIGVSKISGTFKGVVLAGWYILTTIGIEALKK